MFAQAHLEDGSREVITRGLVQSIVSDLLDTLKSKMCTSPQDQEVLEACARIFMEIVTAYEFPEFITTYLYNHTMFRQLQNT